MNKAVAGMRRYIIEFSISICLYAAVLLLHRRLIPIFPDWKTIIALLPCVPILLAATAIWRGLSAMDEYHRRNALNGIAFGAFVLGVSACLYPFLRNAELIPELRLGMAWPIMAMGWLMAGLGYMWRDGVSEGGRGQTAKQFGVFFGFLAGTALLYWLAAQLAGWPHDWRPLLAAAGFGAIPAALYQVFIGRCGRA